MEVVGLITCERIVLGEGAKVLIRESAKGSWSTKWKKKVMTRRMKKNEREDEKQRVKGRVVESIKTTTS